MKKEDLVSIIMPLYNCEGYVEQSIRSVMKQSYKNWELIIIDDNSTDKSKEIIKNIKRIEERIVLLELENNLGPAKARNKGIEYARGRYIAFLDSDDIWNKNKLEWQTSFMKKNKLAFSFTAFERIYTNAKNRIFHVPPKVSFISILLRNIICNSSVMLDVSLINKVYYPDIRKRQDYGLWLDVLKNRIKYAYGLDQILTSRNIRPDSVSSNKIKLVKYNWELYRKILKMPLLISFILVWKDILIKLLKIK